MLSSKIFVRGIALTAFASITSAGASAAGNPKGIWINDTGRGAIEIKDCGNAICGHVVWVKDPSDTKGCGKQIIGEARPAGGSTWGGGWVYSPEKKKRYDVELTPVGDDKLRVIGYAGVKLFSRTMIWKRAPGDLVRCGTTEAAAKPAPAKVSEIKAPEVKAAEISPQPKADDVKTPEIIAPPIRSTVIKPNEVKPEAKVPEAAPTAKTNVPVPPPPAKAPAEKPDAGAKSETAPASSAEELQEATTNEDQEASSDDLGLGDLDLKKILKRTKNGGCKLDLPWVKIEFGCE